MHFKKSSTIAISDLFTLRSISKYMVTFGTIICNKHNELQVDIMFNSCG